MISTELWRPLNPDKEEKDAIVLSVMM